MSILMTSINNILSFLAGTLLPIPALRSFCAQSSILLTFNFIAILTLYPAIISIDLRRRKAKRRDVFCCLFTEHYEDNNYSVIMKPQIQVWWSGVSPFCAGEEDGRRGVCVSKPAVGGATERRGRRRARGSSGLHVACLSSQLLHSFHLAEVDKGLSHWYAV